LPLDDPPKRRSVTSSFESGASAGAAARLTSPATIRRKIPNATFFVKVEFDFIMDIPQMPAHPQHRGLLIDRVAPAAKSCPAEGRRAGNLDFVQL
jgi:hypothetical protein